MPNADGTLTYYETLTAAINAVAESGYQSAEQIDYWADQIRRAAERSMRSEAEVERMVREALAAVFKKQVDLGGVLRRNPGVTPYTLARVRPELHAELSRRVAASIDLIKINRPVAIAKTQQRFRGWATSVPPGGAVDVKKTELKQDIRKALAQLPYAERRVAVDQSQKLFSAINTTVAVNGGAIAAIWHSHKAQRGYNGRPDHNARDGKVFAVRGNWALEQGLMKPNKNGFTDEIEQPAEFVFCRCHYQYLMSLRSLPEDMITVKGKEALAAARQKVAALA